MSFILCLICISLAAGASWLAFEFGRDFRRAWRHEFPRVNRRHHRIEIGFKACKSQERH